MPAWTNLLNSLFLPGKRILGATGMALRDNLLAALEGDAAAPRVHPAALEGYRGRVSLNGQTAQQFLNLGRYAVLRVDAALGAVNRAAVSNLEVSFSNDNGGSWAAWQSLAPFRPFDNTTSTLRRDLIGNLYINMVTGSVAYRFNLAANPGTASETNSSCDWGTLSLTVPANANAIRFRFSQASPANTGILDLEGLSGVAP